MGGGTGGIVMLIPSLSTRWRGMVSFMLQLLYSQRDPLVPME